MKNKRVLISGAGVSGLALAYWLRRYGFAPTIVERASSLRSGGYKIDIRGAALDVVDRMGLREKITEAQTDIQGASVVDRDGNKITEMSGDAFGLRVNDDLEIMRGDLCKLLMDQVSDVECIFSDGVREITQDSKYVNVSFDKREPRHFDLVIGADGLHSPVRKFTFGEEANFTRELGMYICIYTVPNDLQLDRWEMEYSDSRRLVNLYSAKGDSNAKVAFLFSSKNMRVDPRNVAQQKQLVSSIYADLGWEVPRLLAAMKGATDFYFDSVTQVEMERWSKGRVALVGDAGYCASPVSGQGTSLALVGAYVLAGELARASGNYEVAFARYEEQMRGFVKQNQKLGEIFAKNMKVGRQSSILRWLRDQFLRLLPGQGVEFMTQRSVRRVNRAAHAITLKDLPATLV